MKSPQPKLSSERPASGPKSQTVLVAEAANEFVFAVVGHVGSGTSETANKLKELLETDALPGGKFDAEILKAREIIGSWATKSGHQAPSGQNNDLALVEAYQDLGDLMRSNGDHAAVAKGFAVSIRNMRAKKTGITDPGDEPVKPDGKRRAYILDSIRHPAEVDLLRHIYQDAFVLIGVVCEEKARLARVVRKYKNAGEQNAMELMKRDAKAPEKHGQRVSDAFHMADFFVDNTIERFLDNQQANPDWNIVEVLSRLVKIVVGTEVVRPTFAETAMRHAFVASMESACLSRQVGAAIVDANGNLIAAGTNEVPRAGGGVYGDGSLSNGDHRCVFRPDKFCSNTTEQNAIINALIEDIPELSKLGGIRKIELRTEIRRGRIGDLIEFSRAVHAEVNAIFTAGREGKSTVGTRLFVTTFPCHYCARGVVTAGIDEVQFIEPYPKSQALLLHSDSITVSSKNWIPPSDGGQRVLFHPFTGVAPRLYDRAFRKDRDLKDDETGRHIIGEPNWGTPWHLRRSSYVQLEAALAKTTQ